MAIEVSPSSERSPAVLEEASTAELVREAMDEARELVRLEVALAKEEVKAELKQVQRAAIGFGVALGVARSSCSASSAVALVLALGGTALVALARRARVSRRRRRSQRSSATACCRRAPLEKTRHRLRERRQSAEGAHRMSPKTKALCARGASVTARAARERHSLAPAPHGRRARHRRHQIQEIGHHAKRLAIPIGAAVVGIALFTAGAAFGGARAHPPPPRAAPRLSGVESAGAATSEKRRRSGAGAAQGGGTARRGTACSRACTRARRASFASGLSRAAVHATAPLR